MKMSKLSNQTNSQDPQAVNSRVFVGNLNTFQCSKTDVERMFQIYGRLAGISMHKGYAFVQFTNPFDARNACHGEDGRTVLSQTLDVNMVAEPKPHQVGRKRQNITKTGNDWDYYYDSYYSSTLFRAAGARPKKRKRLMTPQARMLTDSVNNGTLNAAVVAAAAQQQQQQQQQQQHQQHAAAAAMAAMANLLPQQQQLILHQQSLLSNGAAAAAVAAAAANGMVNGVGGAGSGTTPHHSLNAFLQQQQQQQQQHQHQQQQHQFAGLHLKPTSPTINAPPSAVLSTVVPSSSSCITNNNPMTTTAASMANREPMSTLCVNSSSLIQQQTNHKQQQQQQHQQQQQQQQLFQQQLLQQVNAQQQQQQQQNQQQQQQTQWGPFKLYSNPDTLICGNCRECFSDLGELLDHKRTYCKLRFTCKCQDIALASKNPPAGAKLLCAVCKDAFTNPWDLMVHAQAAHMVNIYELGNEAADTTSAANININNNNNANSINKNNKAINGISQMNGTSVTESDVCISTAYTGAGAGTVIGGGEGAVELVPSAVLSPPKVNGTLNGSGGGGGVSSCNNSFSGDGNASDGDACMEINGGMMCSPNGSIPKEEIHSDGGASLDGQMSISSPTHHSDDMMKLNGSVSSRGSSPALEPLDDQPRACIVRTLSIEATSPPNATAAAAAALGLMTTSLAISLTNGTATVSPQ